MKKNAYKVFKNIIELVNRPFFQKYKPLFRKKVDGLICFHCCSTKLYFVPMGL